MEEACPIDCGECSLNVHHEGCGYPLFLLCIFNSSDKYYSYIHSGVTSSTSELTDVEGT
jgi:hypothetical protein